MSSGSRDARPAAHGGDSGDAHAPDAPVRPWVKLKSEHAPHMLLFRPRWDTLANPRSGERFERLVLETPDWVNVVALTPERRVVLVSQYRFGTGALSLEIPGGVLDPGEAHEAAARRELAEETGYTAPRWTYLGAVEPNPAFHTNLCHHWLAEDAVRTLAQELDSGEDISVSTLALDEVRELVRSGSLRHSLVITALARVIDLRRA
jgi:8-oxo-dGTP pyrophosphatase MutT (NUDIX family)